MYKNNLHILSDDVSPETTVIVFDLHNVVFKKQTRKIVASCLKLMRKGTWRYMFHPVVWYRAYRIRTKSNVAEDIFHKMTSYYPGLAPFRGEFIRLTNIQKPIRRTVELIKELKGRGYKLYVLSNIGRDTYTELCHNYPDIAAYFDGAFTACAEKNYLHKPHKGFYEGFKEFLKSEGHGDKQILFIDDLKKNLIAAAHCNIAGVHYTSSRRLASTLKNLDVL